MFGFHLLKPDKRIYIKIRFNLLSYYVLSALVILGASANSGEVFFSWTSIALCTNYYNKLVRVPLTKFNTNFAKHNCRELNTYLNWRCSMLSQCVCLSICPSVCLSVCLFVYLSIHVSALAIDQIKTKFSNCYSAKEGVRCTEGEFLQKKNNIFRTFFAHF